MKRWYRVGMSMAVALVALGGCGSSGGGPLGADVRWQLRCPDDRLNMGCNTNRNAVIIRGEDGEVVNATPVSVSCEVVDLPDDTWLLNANVRDGQGNGLRLRNVVIDPVSGGVVATPGCRVEIDEDGVLFLGSCGPGAISGTQPCRLTTFQTDDTVEEGVAFSTTVQCEDMAPEGAPTQTFDLASPDVLATDEPSPLVYFNCDGV